VEERAEWRRAKWDGGATAERDRAKWDRAHPCPHLRDRAHPCPHLSRDRAHPCPHLRRDRAHPCPHLRRDRAHPFPHLRRDWGVALQRKGFNFLSVFKWEDRKGWGACELMHRKWESA
jgi:hypothetical protein